MVLFSFINILFSDAQGMDFLGFGIASPAAPAPPKKAPRVDGAAPDMDFMGFGMATPAEPTRAVATDASQTDPLAEEDPENRIIEKEIKYIIT